MKRHSWIGVVRAAQQGKRPASLTKSEEQLVIIAVSKTHLRRGFTGRPDNQLVIIAVSRRDATILQGVAVQEGQATIAHRNQWIGPSEADIQALNRLDDLQTQQNKQRAGGRSSTKEQLEDWSQLHYQPEPYSSSSSSQRRLSLRLCSTSHCSLRFNKLRISAVSCA